MKPSARTCHATRLLLELAHHKEPTPLRASTLSVTIGISIKLLEKIVRPLKAAGLIRSVRGATGGYVLGRSPALITLADVLTTMEGAVFKPQCCEADADCLLMDGCPTGSVWIDISRHMEAKFRATTLADFMIQPREVCPSRSTRAAQADSQIDSPSERRAAAAIDAERMEAALPRRRVTAFRRRMPGSVAAVRANGRPRLA